MLPLWAGPVAMGGVFLFLGCLVPVGLGVGQTQGASNPFARFACFVAPAVTLLVGGAWAKALHTRHKNDERLEKQRDLTSLKALSWREFELLMAEVFRREGFAVAETQSGPDGGVDLVLTLGGQTRFVQCKQWRTQKVGVAKVRELWGVVAAREAKGGVFVTSGHYTQEASLFAEGLDLRLIDGPRLLLLTKSLQRTTAAIANKSPSTPNPRDGSWAFPTVEERPACPRCGSEMRVRTSRRGNRAGEKFLGCSTFPRCRGTRNLSEQP